ncbi:MAG: peptidoglycan DD-metalloendopeptidase family protein [Microgenomates group bacterium]
MIRKIFLIALVLSLVFPLTLRAASTDELTRQIAEYTQKLDELAKSKDTLANQIKIINSQVSLTLLKITQTESNIKITETEIIDLGSKISQLDQSLNQLTSKYIEEVQSNYKLSKKYSSLSIFLTKNFNEFWQQYKYISLIQKNSQESLVNMETVRYNYDTQKQQKEKKQQELEALKIKLADQNSSLTKQKQSKANLLEITKNNEVKYQQLKKSAENELSSLLKAQFVGKRNVKAGDPLGLMGNSGYSFGDHLHFGLYNLSESNLSSWTYQSDIDSSEYLSRHLWPMNDPLTLTQGRGNTKYSYLYADRFHHGIDMVSPNKTIRAVNDGVAYFFRNPSSSLGNHVKLFHPDGKMTLYLHMQ